MGYVNRVFILFIRMTSMTRQLSREIDMKDVRRAMKGHMETFLKRELVQMDLTSIRELLK